MIIKLNEELNYVDKINSLDKDIDVLMDCKSIEDVANAEFYYFVSDVYVDDINRCMNRYSMSFKRALLQQIKGLEKLITDTEEEMERYKNQVDECEKLFPKLLSFIQDNFEDVQVKDEYKIYFNAPQFNELSEVIKFIAKPFNLTSGMFTFDSSFTTHDAYTPKYNADLKIGLTRDGTPTECQVLFPILLEHYSLPYNPMEY